MASAKTTLASAKTTLASAKTTLASAKTAHSAVIWCWGSKIMIAHSFNGKPKATVFSDRSRLRLAVKQLVLIHASSVFERVIDHDFSFNSGTIGVRSIWAQNSTSAS